MKAEWSRVTGAVPWMVLPHRTTSLPGLGPHSGAPARIPAQSAAGRSRSLILE